MSDKKKINIALLGKELVPKMRLAQLILRIDGNTDNTVAAQEGENDRFKIIDWPKNDSSDPDPDVSLLVINKKESKKIEQLNTTSHLVVLSLDCLEKLISAMGEPAEHTTSQTGMNAGSHEPRAESTRGNRDSINIILLGLTGTGKSACGNTILGKQLFRSEPSSTPVTRKCQKGEVCIGGRLITVIDTPDYDEVDTQTLDEHVRECKALLQPGPCVYLLVMQLGRFTDGERDILEKLEKAFSQKIRDKTIILFTHGESLKRENTSLKAFVDRTVPLKDVVMQCGGRYHVFANNTSDRQQVTELMQKVNALIGHSQDMEGHTSDEKCVVC